MSYQLPNNTIEIGDEDSFRKVQEAEKIVERIFFGISEPIYVVPNHKLQLFSYGNKCFGYTIGYDDTDLWLFACKSYDDFNNGRGKIIHYPCKSKERLCLKKRTILEALYDLG